MAGIVERLDAQVEQLFQGWNLVSTLLALLLVAALVYPVVFGEEPDTHPLILSRQANISPVRQQGQSASYRSSEVPHGFPLKTGLNVKEPGAAKWTPGKDGDLRDIWRQALRGWVNEKDEETGRKGKVLAVFGREQIRGSHVNSITKQIVVCGRHVQQQGGHKVAVYLPNSVELLCSVFAAAFYGFSPLLIPYHLPLETVISLLGEAKPDYLITTAGSVPLAEIKNKCPQIKGTLLVVEETSRQVEWHDSSQNVSVWHELVDAEPADLTEVPQSSFESIPDINMVWTNEAASSHELVVFSQKNIVAATAAQISAIPKRHRMGPSDLYLPADSLAAPHILVQTLAALFSNSSLLLTSIASPNADLSLVTQLVAPTIIAASAESALKLHKNTSDSASSAAKKIALHFQTKALTSGYMPKSSVLTKLNDPITANVGNKPGQLRLLYVFEKANASSPPLSSVDLSDLRAFTGARVIYALVSPFVAGTVAQTNFYDYRRETETSAKHSHFGVSPSCLEIKVVDDASNKTVEGGPARGQLVATGPAVTNGTAQLGIKAQFRDDGTVCYI